MLNQQEILELYKNMPALKKTISLQEALQNPNSLEYQALTVLSTIQNAKQQLISQNIETHIAKLTEAAEKIYRVINDTPVAVKSAGRAAAKDEQHQQNLALIQNLQKQLAELKKNHEKLQKELNESLSKQSNILDKLDNVREDKETLFDANNTTLSKQEYLVQFDKLPELKKSENIDIIKNFAELGLTGAALLRANKIKKSEQTIKNELNENLEQCESLGKKIVTLGQQLQKTAQQLMQLGVSLKNQESASNKDFTDTINTVSQSASELKTAPTPKPSSAKRNLPDTDATESKYTKPSWITRAYNKIFGQKEEEKQAENSSTPTFTS